MSRTRNLAAYLAWTVTLAAVLAPPAVATAGIEVLSQARDALFAMVENDAHPARPAAIAGLRETGRRA